MRVPITAQAFPARAAPWPAQHLCARAFRRACAVGVAAFGGGHAPVAELGLRCIAAARSPQCGGLGGGVRRDVAAEEEEVGECGPLDGFVLAAQGGRPNSLACVGRAPAATRCHRRRPSLCNQLRKAHAGVRSPASGQFGRQQYRFIEDSNPPPDNQ